MCGICGFYSKKNIGVENLKAMNDALYHRGPNDSGEEIFETASGMYVGLGHRRLSILDLSVRGHQPMHSRNQDTILVFNGEIYNFNELKKEIDYDFTSCTDSEVIIAAYEKWGVHCVEHFNGMFSFAIYSRKEEVLYLFRDRMGVKPLYYWIGDNGIVFASELKAIMKHPEFRKEINKDVISKYFAKLYICSPSTIFKNVFKLQPGEYLMYRGGELKTYTYWNAYGSYSQNVKHALNDFDEAKRRLKETLIRSVNYRLLADVPVGVFLSGGYDSSLIAAIAQSQSPKPIKTFSIGFNDKETDESQFAIEVSKHLGTDHTNVTISEERMLELINSIPTYYDEPFADGSQLPMMLVADVAKSGGVTVALSGDGGDELFCGYSQYLFLDKAQKLDPFVSILHGIGSIPIRGGKIEDFYPYNVQAVTKKREKNAKTQLFNLSREKIIRQILVEDIPVEVQYKWEEKYKIDSWTVKRMILDMETYLPDDICCKVDRATMRYSLEARCPLLDKNVVELSYRIPQKFKCNKGTSKYILKEIAYDYIPRELLDRPKHGFGIPYSRWLKGPLKDKLLKYVNEEKLIQQGIFNADFMNKLVAEYLQQGKDVRPNYSDIIWAYLMFQMWYEEYIGF